jgi:adenine phosphoribosyltransferase
MDEIRKYWHECPVQETEDYEYIVNPITDQIPACKPQVLEKTCDALVEMGDFEKADIILGEEDRGGILIPFVAKKTGLPFSIAKWYPSNLEGEHQAQFRNGYTDGSLYINGISEGVKVVIVDDLVSTGGTLENLIKSVNEIGAEVVEAVTICEKPEFGGIEKVEEETGIRPKSGFQIVIEDGKSRVVGFE